MKIVKGLMKFMYSYIKSKTITPKIQKYFLIFCTNINFR